MRELGAGEVTAWVGPHVCGGCYEVPAEMRAEVAAVVPAAVRDDDLGHARRSTSAPGCAPSSAARASTVVDVVPLHPRVATTSTPTAATAPRAGRLAGLIRLRVR